MYKSPLTILLFAVVASCNTQPQNEYVPQNEAKNAKAASYGRMKLDFTEPVQIDTTSYVMFPLTIAHDDNRFMIKSSGEEFSHWNMIFLNTKTGEYHLLDTVRQMLIKGYDAGESSSRSETDGKSSTTGGHLFYEIITDDTNYDGKLDENDPVFLFMSDKEGENFKQISPANYHLRSWKLINETGKVLMYAVNQKEMKQDYQEQQVAVFVYDIKSGAPARPAFSTDFINGAKKLFNEHWVKK